MTSAPTSPQQPTRRSLQARLTLFYAAGVFLAGIVVLIVADLPLMKINSTQPAGHPNTSTITNSGRGIGPAQLLTYSAIALAILVPVALALGWLIAGRFLRPLRSITTTARAISAGNLHQRLNLGEPTDELTELGHTLDDLFARLQASFDAQHHFVANASHELRTPLAALRTLLEVTLANRHPNPDTLRSACQDALALGEHQERLVQALLTLATSERGITRWDTLDLGDIAHGVLVARHSQAAAQDVRLIEHLAPAPTTGDPRLIETLIANLVDNAIRHNHPDGYAEIATAGTDKQASITVTNSGPMIREDELQRLFQPFQRLSRARNGHHDGYGLGLAIVNAVTQAHHGTLTTRTQPAGGLSIKILLPKERPESSPGHRSRASTGAAETSL